MANGKQIIHPHSLSGFLEYSRSLHALHHLYSDYSSVDTAALDGEKDDAGPGPGDLGVGISPLSCSLQHGEAYVAVT